MAPVPYTPHRANRSMRVVLDWLRIRSPGAIQADTLVRGANLVARLSVERTATEIRAMAAAKRELHRRFTCNQRVGNVFRRTFDGIDFRPGVRVFLDRAVALFHDRTVAPGPAAADAAVRRLADELFGPLPEGGRDSEWPSTSKRAA